jgi:Arc/MetJ family transcription regulator
VLWCILLVIRCAARGPLAERPHGEGGYIVGSSVYIAFTGKHLVDIDEDALRTARAKFGSATIKETVNRALRQAGGEHRRAVKRRLDSLAGVDLADREQAWR